MKARKLKVGDKIRIIALPGAGVPVYYLHRETKRAYRILISRRRSLRISRIDEDGLAWYNFRTKRKDGAWEHHFMCITPDDDNWVAVKQRRKKS